MNSIILSGGKNTRISTQKAFMEINGQIVIEKVLEILYKLFSKVIIVTNNPEEYKKYKTEITTDIFKNKGPLSGIYSGLTVSDTEYNFVTGCDMPFLNDELIKYMTEKIDNHDVIIPKVNEKLEPLHAVYSKKCLLFIKESLDKNNLSIQSFFNQVKVKHITEEEVNKFDPKHLSFFNINTEDDLERAQTLHENLRYHN